MYKFKFLNTSNRTNSIYVQGQQPSSGNVATDTASIIFQNSSNNMSEIALRNDDVIVRSSVTGSNMRMSSIGSLTLGHGAENSAAAKEMFEVYNGNVLSKNVCKLTKTIPTYAFIDIVLNWENVVLTNQYYVVVETCQQVSDGLQAGARIQKHMIRLFSAGDATSPQIKFSQIANTFGNLAPASSMNVTSYYATSTSLTIRSTVNWSTPTGPTPSHSFTMEVIQTPASSTVGFIWLS